MIFSNKEIVKYSPVATTILIEGGVISQITRMVTEGSANDQSLLGWAMVWLALALWFNWYRVFTPDQMLAKWSTLGGMVINTAAMGVIIWFRFLA